MIDLSDALVLDAFNLLDAERPASNMEISRAIVHLHGSDTVRIADDAGIRDLVPQGTLHSRLDALVGAGKLAVHSGIRWRMKAVTLADLHPDRIYYARSADADLWSRHTLEVRAQRRRALEVLAGRHAGELDELVLDQLLAQRDSRRGHEQEGDEADVGSGEA